MYYKISIRILCEENNMNTNLSTEENTNINDILENNCLNPNETENENNESKEQLRKEKRRMYIANIYLE